MHDKVEGISPEQLEVPTSNPKCSSEASNSDDDSILDVSGKNLEFSLVDVSNPLVRNLYLYKNEFNLLPGWVGQLQKLKTLKFFANEVNLFPAEFGSLTGLERLQVKISPPELNGLALHKMKGLKELELSKALRRPSVFPLLSEIAQLKCLTKLSLCHFSIRCLPPEIGCLSNLEYLDLSFNKMKSLPNEITYLNSLISLKVSNNKLVDLPSGLSTLQQLENLDLSNNRLTSLGPLEPSSMQNLRSINLQYNKLNNYQMPSWICCNLEGNDGDICIDDYSSSSVEMDVYESTIQGGDRSLSYNGSCHTKTSSLSGSSSSRCFSARKSSKRWKRRHYLQQKARQERLNNSRKWKGEKYNEGLSKKPTEVCKLCDTDILSADAIDAGSSKVECLEDADSKETLSDEVGTQDLQKPNITVGEMISSKADFANDNCFHLDNPKQGPDYCQGVSVITSSSVQQDDSLLHSSKNTGNCKRHCDKTLHNPKPCKSRRSMDESVNLSCKYSNVSFCGAQDYLADGFYDAGRDRTFMQLASYEQNFHLDSREVILLDRGKDEVLDAITLSAQALVSQFKRLNSEVKDEGGLNNLQVASLLALFVSDHFGGCDRTSIIDQTRKVMSGSNYTKPFICTCSTGNMDWGGALSKKTQGIAIEVIVFADLCERALQCIKSKQNSVIVPIGSLKFGVCRHRALLLKYLCDRMEPPVPCELIRGYLDFSPHAWNVVLTKRGDSWVRVVVDACRPHDIREETDQEYYCRYIPLSRTKVPPSTEVASGPETSLPSLSACDEIEKANSTTLVRSNHGSADIVAKVRNLEVSGSSFDEMRNFEYSCLGEVRILGALEHPCIVKMLGHQISSTWVSAADGNPQHRMLQSAIYMEYVKGGSLKSYVEKLSKEDEKHVPVKLALSIATDVASALTELHSKHIIHRDIKSENILVDLDKTGGAADVAPVVKLCDFDRAVPLRSSLHTCCIAHCGIPPPDICVGTPRWMSPEVLVAMHERTPYGLEVDIWSYGCLLLELLTLQVPFSGLSDSVVHELLSIGQRPKLRKDMEELISAEDSTSSESGSVCGETQDRTSLRFMVDLYYRCTEKDPKDRPLAKDIYESLLSHTKESTTLQFFSAETP